MSVFLDTSFLLAYHSKRDKFHEPAVSLVTRIFSGEFGTLYSSDYVFDEIVTLSLSRLGKKESLKLGGYILNSEIQLLFLNNDLFQDSWKLFIGSENLSFTDCSIVSLMKANNVKYLASFDKEFKQFSKEIKVLDG